MGTLAFFHRGDKHSLRKTRILVYVRTEYTQGSTNYLKSRREVPDNDNFLSFRRGWRYGQDRARAPQVFVRLLVLPHAGRYTCLDQGTAMLVVAQVKDWLSKVEIWIAQDGGQQLP